MLNNLQVLRGIAAMLVVWVHTQLMVTTAFIPTSLRQVGFGGVDLFFVISGFIIVHSTSGSRDWSTFLKRRFFRVAPLYYVFTLIAVVICYVRPSIFNLTGIDFSMIGKSFLFIPFEITTNSIYPVYPLGWTLNYEMFFYAAFAPMLLLGSLKARIAVLGAALVVLATIGTFIHHPDDIGLIPYFYTRPVILDFVFGLIIGGTWQHFPTRPAILYYVLLIAGFVGLVFSGRVLPSENLVVFPATATVLRYGVPSALIVTGMAGLERCDRKIDNRVLRLLGDASYSIYLSHFFIFLPLASAASRFLSGDVATLLLGVFTMIAAPVFGVFIYRNVERPLTGDYYSRLRKPPLTSRPTG